MASIAKWFVIICRLEAFIVTPAGLQYSPVQEEVLRD